MHDLFYRLSTIIKPYTIWIIILIGIVPFLSLLHAPFVSDDWEFLSHADTLSYTAERIFGTNTNGHTNGGSYRPIVNLYWGTMYQLFDVHVVPYRISILVFFALTVWLLFRTVQLLPLAKSPQARTTIALVAAALSAVFPGRVEALAWVAVVNDTLLTLVLVGAWYAYIRYISASHWSWFGVSVILFAVGIGIKETASTFPAILAGTYLLLFIQECSSIRASIRQLVRLTLHMLPFALVLGGFFLLRYAVIGLVSEDYTGSGGLALLQNDPMRAYISMFVTSLLVDPLRTAVSTLLYTCQAWLAVLCLYGAGIALVLVRWRTLFVAGVLLLWYGVALFPTSRFGVNLWQHGMTSAEGERYTYYPSIFLAMLLSYIVVSLYARSKEGVKWVFWLLCAVAFVYTTYGTVQKVEYWKIAAVRSELIIESFADIVNEHGYDRVVVVGLPDALFGAFLWRNAFALRLVWQEMVPLSYDDIVVTDIRSVPSIDTTMSLTTSSEGVLYTSAPTQSLVSPPNIETEEYTATHIAPTSIEHLSISYTHFTHAILITPTDREERVGWLFFDGGVGWISY